MAAFTYGGHFFINFVVFIKSSRVLFSCYPSSSQSFYLTYGRQPLRIFLSIFLLVHPPGQAPNLMKRRWSVCKIQPGKIPRLHKPFRQTIQIFTAVFAVFADPGLIKKPHRMTRRQRSITVDSCRPDAFCVSDNGMARQAPVFCCSIYSRSYLISVKRIMATSSRPWAVTSVRSIAKGKYVGMLSATSCIDLYASSVRVREYGMFYG